MSTRFARLDTWPTAEAVQAMFEGQLAAVATIAAQVGAIGRAAEAAAARLRGSAGRLVYAGAGTSGRVAVQDGVELGPTFDWPSERLLYALAGGAKAVMLSAETAEDDAEAGEAVLREAALGAHDVVIGVAASGTTPFTVAAIRLARAAGALTVGMASNSNTPLLEAAEHPVFLNTGAEVVAGSTRMKAGTAQKVALNLLSTAIMIRLGRVYGPLMIDMRVSNRKLRHRAIIMTAEIAGVDRDAAEAALDAAGGKTKLAVLIASGLDRATAEGALHDADDNLRAVLERAP